MNLSVGILATTVESFVLVKDVNDLYLGPLLHLSQSNGQKQAFKTKAIFAIKQNAGERKNLLT